MARTADHDAASPTMAHSGTRRPAQQQLALESEAAVVLTPDGHRWLMARAAGLASEPDQAGWVDGGPRPRGGRACPLAQHPRAGHQH